MTANYDQLLSEIWLGRLDLLPDEPPPVDMRADPSSWFWEDGGAVIDLFGFAVHETHQRLAVAIRETLAAGAERICLRMASPAGTVLGLAHGIIALQDCQDAEVPTFARIIGDCCGSSWALAAFCSLKMFNAEDLACRVGVGNAALTWGTVWGEPPVQDVLTLVTAIANRHESGWGDLPFAEIARRLVDDGTSSRGETANALNYLCGSNTNGVLL